MQQQTADAAAMHGLALCFALELTSRCQPLQQPIGGKPDVQSVAAGAFIQRQLTCEPVLKELLRGSAESSALSKGWR